MSKAKKSLGQNFLTNPTIISHIIKSANLQKNEEVIEIGPGKGALTKELVKICNKLTAFELDSDLIEPLRNLYASNNVEIINQDFLKADLCWSNKKVLIANIPYYITSDILFKLFYNSELFDRAIIMLQKEVADRLMASASSSKYGKLTITAQYFSDIEKIINVSRQSFTPSPKVDSTIVSLKFKETIFTGDEQKSFLLFVKNCFFMRRKTLVNNLKKINIELSAQEFKKLNISINARPQELTLDKFIQLYLLVYKIEKEL